MADYGIKVVKSGADITTSDVREVLMSSQYPMLKYHLDTLGTMTITAGGTAGTLDFSHSLGYVPAFVGYVEYAWSDSYQRMLPHGIAGNPVIITAHTDTSKVRCRVNMISQVVDRDFIFRVIVFKDKISD